MPSFIAQSDGSSSAYTELEPGIYNAVVTKAEACVSSNNNPMIRLYLRVFGAHGAVEIRENLTFVIKSYWKIEQFWKATGHDFKPGDPITIEARDCFGLSCWVSTDKKPGEKDGVFFPYIDTFMREDECPYKGVSPDYRGQSGPLNQTPQQRPATGGGYQQGNGWGNSGGYQQGGNTSRLNNAPGYGRQPSAPPAAPSQEEDDDIPF